MNPIVLLTDFGLDDHYAGVLHAVLAQEAPGAERIDLLHTVPAGDVWTACFHLRCAWPYLPQHAVVLAVVDPEVGTDRKAVAVRFEHRWLVAPDNGLAAAVVDRHELAEAWVLSPQQMGLPQPSATFHGRDVFAPAAARLARGESAVALGAPAAPLSLCGNPLPRPEDDGSTVGGTVLHVDRFGNLITNLEVSMVPKRGALHCGTARIERRVQTYGEAPAGKVVYLQGSAGYLELAMNGSSAAATLGAQRGDRVEIRTL